MLWQTDRISVKECEIWHLLKISQEILKDLFLQKQHFECEVWVAGQYFKFNNTLNFQV